MDVADYNQWWKHQGSQELRQLLNEQWAPIGFKGALPDDEYDSYHAAVVQLLREGASTQRLAEHLADVEQTQIGSERTPQELLPVGEEFVCWFAGSLARWEASGPTN